MSCEGCIQKIKAANEQEQQTYKAALALATKTGEWVAIYTDEQGQRCYCLASHAAGLIITQYVTPQLPDATA